ncbi:hypothetical protein LEP1GSC045_3178 [Leptospira interrogans serovar Pomona str. Kennewicki LC82-25]|nr:hypothetical protein LEP1GSC045_3178 [Leptospira interrogans serovar Pomona str. Kennewicki LC82-25]EKN98843.1 hypothetical protein LEP1GSC014_2671 [Leptospira interrogans serovar Pomona str. Pomona]EMF33590.1 hypothetical protein LEP1GSC201_1942 [Leptospira interrogans serovar Pomona str. Fox 32256]EMI66397.1 hypothetical protein LEP1GSC200_0752 [Leptospira interrogans serovar Pomona str. CSL10083]EMJ59868.1 hypothetical protein LEP1GSC197_1136 [Leptospira interrogans serovar Pomona str. CS
MKGKFFCYIDRIRLVCESSFFSKVKLDVGTTANQDFTNKF